MGVDGKAAAAAGKGRMPHAGKPLPGGNAVQSQPWWAGIGQSFNGAKEGMGQQWTQTQRNWKKNKKFSMPGACADASLFQIV